MVLIVASSHPFQSCALVDDPKPYKTIAMRPANLPTALGQNAIDTPQQGCHESLPIDCEQQDRVVAAIDCSVNIYSSFCWLVDWLVGVADRAVARGSVVRRCSRADSLSDISSKFSSSTAAVVMQALARQRTTEE
jgi:hypothetical protein